MLVSSSHRALLGVLFLVCLGCRDPLVYAPPTSLLLLPGTRLVPQPLAMVWATLETQDSQPAFVLQTQDPAAGLLTFTYTGTPDRYVTCGEMILAVPRRGARAAPSAPGLRRHVLAGTSHPVQLHGQIRLLVMAESATQTRLMTTVRYTLTHTETLQTAGTEGAPLPAETIGFTSGQSGQGFRGEMPPLICQPTGVLEQEVFALVP